MIKSFILLVTLTLFRLQQDVRVITWSTGKVESSSYESLTFWIKSDRRAYIRYARGASANDVELRWAGTDTAGGQKGFRARFPGKDTTVFWIVPTGPGLQVTARHGKYHKLYRWEREGIDSTTTCDLCPHDEKEAMQWLKQYFLK